MDPGLSATLLSAPVGAFVAFSVMACIPEKRPGWGFAAGSAFVGLIVFLNATDYPKECALFSLGYLAMLLFAVNGLLDSFLSKIE